MGAGYAWIIPARAGFTAPQTEPRRDETDHPRSRGVYTRRRGSMTEGMRIIPARAGFTSAGVAGPAGAQDHPRSRGVYTSCGGSCPAPGGSSPLARGLPMVAAIALVMVGIIPARAGFTAGRGRCRGPARDHPRSRGVYRWPSCASACPTGSSPLARGLRIPVHTAKMTGRIIPARAGFTNPCTDRRERAADHPRSRGVYTHHPASTITAAGSSPLARGLRGPGPLRSMDGEDHPRSRGVYG